jgi:hypothetical protein
MLSPFFSCPWAALIREGQFRRDFNAEFVSPLIMQVAAPWAAIFEEDHFAGLENKVLDAIAKAMVKVANSTKPTLQHHVNTQALICLGQAQSALTQIIKTARETLANEQKDISRSMSSQVQDHLKGTYSQALTEHGPGSSARQKVRAMKPLLYFLCDDVFMAKGVCTKLHRG